jgi:ribonuclease J
VEGAKAVAERVIASKLGRKAHDWADIKNALREETAKFIYKETKRKPMILAVLMEV